MVETGLSRIRMLNAGTAFLANKSRRNALLTIGFLLLLLVYLWLAATFFQMASNLPPGAQGTHVALLGGLVAMLTVGLPAAFGLLLGELFD